MMRGTLAVPQDWRNAAPFYDSAIERVRTALRDPRTPERLVRYYTRSSDFAGATFTQLGGPDPSRVAERDLLAVTLLDVDVPPSTVRSLLEDGSTRDEITALLATDRLPPDVRLEDVTPEVLEAMNELYTALRALVPPPVDRYSVNWATAAKLCARKRPDLFPVRDEVVCRYLGLWPSRYQVDWQVFHTVMSDADVRSELSRLVERAAETTGVDVGDPAQLLRHLDVVVWMHAPHRS